MMKCIIVDDEQLARGLIESYIKKMPYLSLHGKCKNSMEAMRILQQEAIDLMFLDIQMPDLSGVKFLKTLSNKPMVIFTTAYKEYAIEGYQLDVVDYLLKPISFERFVQAVNKAIERKKNNTTENTNEITIQNKKAKDYILLKADHRTHRVKFTDILYIEGLREYVTFFTKNKNIIVLESLKKLEEILPKSNFMRIHKSFIINTDKVMSLYGNQIEIENKKIPVGKSYIEKVRKELFS